MVKDNTRTIWGKQKQPKMLFHGMCSDSYAKSDLKQKTMQCSSLPVATKCLPYQQRLLFEFVFLRAVLQHLKTRNLPDLFQFHLQANLEPAFLKADFMI